MSLHNSDTLLDHAEPTLPALPRSEALVPSGSLPESHHPNLQSTFGNSLLAAAATSGSSTDPTEIAPLQAGFGNTAVSRTLIQRKANDNGEPPTSSAALPGAPTDGPGAGAPTNAPGPGLIVDDDAETVQPGQMKKSAFLGQLRTAVNNTVAEGSAGTPLAAAASSEIDRRFAQASGLSGQQLERTIRSQVPEASGANTAAGFIPPIVGRVRRALEQSVPSALTGAMGVPGTIGSAVSGAATAVAGAVSSAVSGIADAASGVAAGVGSTLSNIGSLFFKARNEGPRETQDPEAIQTQLGAGQPLDGGVRSRMEAAYGQSFSSVEVHADANAGGLSENLNARAFTVGQHIAFGAGEYQPGTLIGDALIAHELAHVMQQSGGAPSPAQKGATEYGALEEDADEAAVGAVISSWSGARKGLAKIEKMALPSLKSGLRLQRCKKKPAPPQPIPSPKIGQTYEEWLRTFPGFTGSTDRDITSLAPEKLKQYITGPLGVPPDCADVSLLLRHFYLESQGKTTTIKVSATEEYKIGAGVTDKQVGQCMIQLGTIHFQEERNKFRIVSFYKKGASRSRNLKDLLDAGLKPGDLLVWQRLPTVKGNFSGHVQTVQAIDRAAGLITVVQGNMEDGVGVGLLQQRQRSFKDLTGVDDGNADILNLSEESFFGAGPWIE